VPVCCEMGQVSVCASFMMQPKTHDTQVDLSRTTGHFRGYIGGTVSGYWWEGWIVFIHVRCARFDLRQTTIKGNSGQRHWASPPRKADGQVSGKACFRGKTSANLSV